MHTYLSQVLCYSSYTLYSKLASSKYSPSEEDEVTYSITGWNTTAMTGTGTDKKFWIDDPTNYAGWLSYSRDHGLDFEGAYDLWTWSPQSKASESVSVDTEGAYPATSGSGTLSNLNNLVRTHWLLQVGLLKPDMVTKAFMCNGSEPADTAP